jgi:hypothetical protein
MWLHRILALATVLSLSAIHPAKTSECAAEVLIIGKIDYFEEEPRRDGKWYAHISDTIDKMTNRSCSIDFMTVSHNLAEKCRPGDAFSAFGYLDRHNKFGYEENLLQVQSIRCPIQPIDRLG